MSGDLAIPAVVNQVDIHAPNDALPPDFEDDLDGMMDDLLFDSHDNARDVSSPLPHTEMILLPTLTHSPDSPDPWRLANAVHMELQENAKLPTFHWTVDRSGSAVATTKSRAGSFSDTLNDVHHLTEHFLSSERHLKYAHSSAADGVAAAPDGTHDATTDQEVDLNPTPLSEIKRRIARHEAKQQQALKTSTNPTAAHSVWHAANQTPYRSRLQRQEPLPIPTKVTKTSQETADAIETTSNEATLSLATSGTNAPVATESLPVALAASQPTVALTSCKHAVAHAVTKPVLQSASEKQSQYGFGRKHVVPSIPASRLKAAPVPVPPAKVATQTVVASPGESHSQLDDSHRSFNDDNEDSGGGGNGRHNTMAYERKKQRAKTARVKLNEAIDQLQIAIGLAGTQSKQRAAQFAMTTVPFRIISDCVATADSAKKWDRPSFVSSAASMIQGLNAQCEALLNALNDERSHKPTVVAVPITVATPAPIVNSGHSSPSHPTASIHSSQHSQCLESGTKHSLSEPKDGMETSDGSSTESSTKRKRLNGTHTSDDVAMPLSTNKAGVGLLEDLKANIGPETYADKIVFTDRNIMDKVASFLEPLSIVRCMRVSKAWNAWGVFCNDELWQNLAAARFGYFNVRQWQGRLEGVEAASSTVAASARIYKTMDAGNVMPHCRLDGKLLLGESRLTGKVSAWAFLVERSNGETMRSVQRSPSMSGNGMYASIPVVQLWIVLQNTGIHGDDVVVREQALAVDASTRRRGNEMKEIDWDERFHKRILNLDGSPYVSRTVCEPTSRHSIPELCRLRLFDSVIIETNMYADGCSTSSKFVQRSNFTQVLVQIRDGTTVPLVIPFPRDALYLLP